jgi:hypothetical protein
LGASALQRIGFGAANRLSWAVGPQHGTASAHHQQPAQMPPQAGAAAAAVQDDDPCDTPLSPGLSTGSPDDMPLLVNASPEPYASILHPPAAWGGVSDPFSVDAEAAQQQQQQRSRRRPLRSAAAAAAADGSESEPSLMDLNAADEAVAAAHTHEVDAFTYRGYPVAAPRPHAGQHTSSASARLRAWHQQQPIDLSDLFTPFGRPLGPSTLLLTRAHAGGRPARRRSGAPAALPAAAATGLAAPAAAAAGAQHGSGGSGGTRHVWRRTGRVVTPPARPTQQQSAAGTQEAEEAEWELEQAQLLLPPRKLLRAGDCRPPPFCSYLQPGIAFSGSQRLLQSRLGASEDEDRWTVRVVLHVSVGAWVQRRGAWCSSLLPC